MKNEYAGRLELEFILDGMMNYRYLDAEKRERVITCLAKYLNDTPIPDKITESWLEGVSIYRRFLERVSTREYEPDARIRNMARKIIKPHSLRIVKR